jgi:DNA-binding transcriptional regulator YiaG
VLKRHTRASWRPLVAAPPRDWHRSADRACLRALAGGSCSTPAGVEPCACRAPWPLILDHAGLWVTPGGRALIAQPYSLDLTSDEFLAFVGYCRDLGLSVRVEGWSWYSPGETLLLVIRRAEAWEGEANEEGGRGTGRVGGSLMDPDSPWVHELPRMAKGFPRTRSGRKVPSQRARAAQEPPCFPRDFHCALSRLGLSQREAAWVLGVSGSQRISEWATGRRRVPRYIQAHLRTLLGIGPTDPWPTVARHHRVVFPPKLRGLQI